MLDLLQTNRYSITYDSVVSPLFVSITKFQSSFRQQRASRDKQQVNFLFEIHSVARFRNVRKTRKNKKHGSYHFANRLVRAVQ